MSFQVIPEINTSLQLDRTRYHQQNNFLSYCNNHWLTILPAINNFLHLPKPSTTSSMRHTVNFLAEYGYHKYSLHKTRYTCLMMKPWFIFIDKKVIMLKEQINSYMSRKTKAKQRTYICIYIYIYIRQIHVDGREKKRVRPITNNE